MTDQPQGPTEQPQEQDASPPPSPVQTVPTPVERGRLVRRPEGKLIAGVCTGLGAYTGIDPVAWRIGFVLLGLTTGIGIVGYIVAWLVMPMAREGEPVPPVPHTLNTGRWIGIGAIAIGALVFAHQAFGFHTSWFWGVLLIGIGVALWGRDWTSGGHGPRAPTPPHDGSAQVDATSPEASPPPPTSTAITPWNRPLPAAPSSGSATTATQPVTVSKPPKEKRPPSILGRVVVGACALAVGIILLLSNLHAMHAHPRFILAILLEIIGAGMLLGTFWGRARWLIAPGIVVALLLTTVSAIPFNLRGGMGDQFYTPTSLADLRPNYEHSAGPLQIDLSQVHFGSHHRVVTVRLGFGPLLVIVPKDVNVVARGHVQGGPLNLFGHQSAGWDVSDTVRSNATGAKGTLRLNTEVTFGPLLVERVGSPAIAQFKVNGFHH
jgi:phage shock protein PspC (stress-responsive transcriptional regulator)